MIKPNDILENNKGLKFKILKLDREEIRNNKSGKKKVRFWKLKFIDSGYVTVVEESTINKLSVKDYFQKDIVGVACFGDAINNPLHHSKIYNNYHSLIRRIYDTKSRSYKDYGKLGVSISDEWLNYNTFLNDIKTLKGFSKEDYINGKITIDKDILQKGVPINKKVYSKDTCIFISGKDNVTECNKRRNKKNIKVIYPNNSIKIFNEITYQELANKLNLKPESISKCINGKFKQYKNFKFGLL